MSRKKSDKFFIHAAQKSGDFKGKRFLGVNYTYKAGAENITVQDLIDFLKEKNIDPSTVELPSSFRTVARV